MGTLHANSPASIGDFRRNLANAQGVLRSRYDSMRDLSHRQADHRLAPRAMPQTCPIRGFTAIATRGAQRNAVAAVREMNTINVARAIQR